MNRKSAFIALALVAAAQAQSGAQIRTYDGSVHIDVPSGGDIHFNEAGDGGVSTSLHGIVDGAAALTSSMQASQSSLTAELSLSRQELESDVDQQVTGLRNELSAGVAAAAGGRQELAGALQTALSAATVAMATCSAQTAASSRSLNSSLTSLTAAEAEHYAELQSLQAALRPNKPTNFTLRPGPYGVNVMYQRISSAMHPLNLTVQVSLRANHTAGNPQWIDQTFVLGESTTASSLVFNAANLTVETAYVTRYRATSRIGAGPWSDVQAFNTTGATIAHQFSCRGNNGVGSNKHQMCTVRITVPSASIVYAWFQGHYMGSGWTYGMIDIDGDNQGPSQINAPAHGYSSTWESFHSARAHEVAAGSHVVRTTLFCGNSGSCRMNGQGMQGFWMEKTPSVQTARCNYEAWAWPFGRNLPMCRINYRTTEASIVASSFNGHGRDSHVYVGVQYDSRPPNQPNSPANMMAHTYSTTWENFGSHRTKYITAGAHRTEAVDWACRMCGSLNGAGLSQIVFPAEVGRAQQFGCTRSWSWNLNTAPQMACRSTLTLPFDSYVMAEVSGHYYAAGPYCVIVVAYDGDIAPSWFSLDQSSNVWGEKMVHYGRSRQWENVFFKRGKVLAAGVHRVEVWASCPGGGGLNGMGMDGMWLRSATAAE